MHRLLLKFTGLCVLICATSARAQAPPSAEAPATMAAAPTTSAPAEIQAILRRLEQQDEELRLLRERLGTLQNQVQPLPPIDASPSPFSPQPVIQASATESSAESPAIFELRDRLASLETRVEQQAATNGGYEVSSDLSMTASWRNGLELSTKNKDFRVHVGGRTQMDISAFNNDPALTVSPSVGGIGLQPDSVQMRRGRLRVDGVMYEVFEFAAEYDFVNTLAPAVSTSGQPAATIPAITDLWVTWTQLPGVGNFRVGNVKEPIGMEHIQSSRWLDFVERSFLQDAIFGPFNNGFNPGMYFFDNWGANDSLWAIGAFSNNGNPFGYGIGDDWALTGRLTWLPIYDEPTNGRYLWHWGVAASIRHPDEDLVRIRTRGNIRSGPPGFLNPIYADTGNMQASQHHLISLENAAVVGPWTFQAEYTGTWVQSAEQPFAPPAVPVARGTPFFHGGYVQLLYFLTGEHRAYNRQVGAFDRVVPYSNAFLVNSDDGCCFGRGAWQVGARYAALDLTDNGINGGILHSGTFGINWWMNPNMHWQFNYDLTHRSEVASTPAGFINGFGIRFAHDF